MENIKIYGTLHNVTGGAIVKAAQVKDDTQNMMQDVINSNLMAGNRYENGEWVEAKSGTGYEIPEGGMPREYLSPDVQESLDNADSAIQQLGGKQDKIGNLEEILSKVSSAVQPKTLADELEKYVKTADIENEYAKLSALDETNQSLKGYTNEVYRLLHLVIKGQEPPKEE